MNQLLPSATWRGDFSALRCVAVWNETHDVKTFVFVAARPASFAYLPGQYITLRLEIDGQLVHRSYTIASSPTRPATLSITTKRIPGGLVSNWMHTNLRPGMDIDALGPQGVFGYLHNPQRRQRLVMLSGGSGITPMLSMIRAICDSQADADIDCIHAARSCDDLICRDELELLARRNPRLRVHWIIEQPGSHPPANASSGRIHLDSLAAASPEWRNGEAYCCGPEPFMSAVHQLLHDNGFAMQHYHRESFDFATMSAESAGAEPAGSTGAESTGAQSTGAESTGAQSTGAESTGAQLTGDESTDKASQPNPPATSPAPDTHGTAEPPHTATLTWPAETAPLAAPPGVQSPQTSSSYRVECTKRGLTFEVAANSTILQAAARQGVVFPSACQTGICGTCRTRKLSGEVDMQHQGGLLKKDIAAGYILLCCSHPLSNLVIEA